MSYEREYLLQGKYNRALNKIAELEERLRTSELRVATGTLSDNSALEARDSEILQNQLLLLQQDLEAVTFERDVARSKLLALGHTDELPMARNVISADLSNDGRAIRLILEIDRCMAQLRQELGIRSEPSSEEK
ncbi:MULTISPECIES: hypothetical protein [unclassified Ensifer]|uniref:hypothetical protein n=1 Tax=unclassified Ensifer TaxID=2633371 RepID=UPI000812C48C|nr:MULTISPECIES: hypothetical protein [unclassified Ensifer]OCP18531.1 hypothetical protein BC361_32095 [Ensifer sp. LC54]OCP18668.1 hypothetical protein BC363_31945 [Ensifer sp. LC384]